jgi:hypothetical protein
MIIRCKIDVSKIAKEHLFKGAKGTYLDITLLENRDGTDKYGNDFMVVQDIGKEARDAGKKGAILGNGKIAGKKAAPTYSPCPDINGNWNPPPNPPAPKQATMPHAPDADEEVPF